MAQTQKLDWLNDWFALDKKFLVSGHPTFTKYLQLSNLEAICSIRYISFRNNNVYLLTIECSSDTWETAEKELTNNSLFTSLNTMFEEKLAIILFSSVGSNYRVQWPDSSFNTYTSNELLTELNTLLPGIDKDAGDPKFINKSVNDDFQIWTRTFLSKYCVVNDFDVIKNTTDSNILFELKRVDESHSSWEPYLNDVGNYSRMYRISRLLNLSSPLTISYNLNDTKTFTIHRLSSIDKEKIKGDATKYDIESSKEILNTKRRYESTRKITRY